MGHSHGHGHHHHGHHHQSVDSNAPLNNILIALLLNTAFAVIEIIGGLWTGSVAIIADAVHDLGDSLAIFSAYFLERFSRKGSSKEYSYGYRRLSLLSAFITSATVLIGAVAVMYLAIPRLFAPEQPMVEGMFGLAILGIVVNGYAAWRVQKGTSLNERAISWHLFEDLLGWVAVLIASVVMMFVDLPIIDPILSIVFTIIIVWNVSKTMRASLRFFLQGTPEGLEADILMTGLKEIEGVIDICDLHLWTLDGQSHVVTMNLVVAPQLSMTEAVRIKRAVKEKLKEKGDFHPTIELVTEGDDFNCGLDR